MNRFSNKYAAWFSTAVALVTAGCGEDTSVTASAPPPEQNHAARADQSASPGDGQSSQWSLSDYVQRYEASVGEPEKVQVLKNGQGEKYLLMEFPSDSVNADGTRDSVKVYKELDGKKAVKATDENKSEYHGTGSYVMFYRYYPYYTSNHYSPYSGYHGYYTSAAKGSRIHTPSERAFAHNNNMHSNVKSVARLNPRTANAARAAGMSMRNSFRASAASAARPRSASGTTRGVFGRAAFRAGGAHGGGFHAGS